MRAPQKERRSACNGDGVYLEQQGRFGNTGGGRPIIIKNVTPAAESYTLNQWINMVCQLDLNKALKKHRHQDFPEAERSRVHLPMQGHGLSA